MRNDIVNIGRPRQFISDNEKDEQWCKQNLDWYEQYGLNQIRSQFNSMLANYKVANGIIEKKHYIVSPDNEYRPIVEALDYDDRQVENIKNYPLVQNIINVLVSEYASLGDTMVYYTVDDFSVAEIISEKTAKIRDVLMRYVDARLKLKLLQLRGQENTKEYQELVNLLQNEDYKKQLPEVDRYYRFNFQSIYERWATIQHAIDNERFKLDELYQITLKDLLTFNRFFIHLNMLEDDYRIERWDPIFTFYMRAPNELYASNFTFIGNVEYLTVAEVIDKFGQYLSEEETRTLESLYPVSGARNVINNVQNDGIYWSPINEQNDIKYGSVQYRRYMFLEGIDVDSNITLENSSREVPLLRVTYVYWTSFRKIGILTRIDDQGNKTVTQVDENYKVTSNPVYNTQMLNERSERTLIYGEHIEWFWIKDIWGGIKISPVFTPAMNNSGVSAIYLGINGKKPHRLKFQFKGDYSIWGAKLPVEGLVNNYGYLPSASMVDLVKPYQIIYNIVNNQINDILLDELGSVLLLDQNVLPKHTLGEDFGDTPYEKAYVLMKQLGILPIDTSLENTGKPLNFNQYQSLDLSQVNKLRTRIELARYFKNEAYEIVGMTPMRLGGMLPQSRSATEAQNLYKGSYALTEIYFILHRDRVLPRFHELRTQLAQWYNSDKPSIQLQIPMSNVERAFFTINGTELLNRDFHVYVSNKTSYRMIVENIKRLATQMAVQTGNVEDIVSILKSRSIADIESYIKEIYQRQQEATRRQMEHEEKMKQMENEARMKELLKDQETKLLLEQQKAQQNKEEKNDEKEYLNLNKVEENKAKEKYDKEMLELKRKISEDRKKQKEKELQLKEQELKNKEFMNNIRGK